MVGIHLQLLIFGKFMFFLQKPNPKYVTSLLVLGPSALINLKADLLFKVYPFFSKEIDNLSTLGPQSHQKLLRALSL